MTKPMTTEKRSAPDYPAFIASLELYTIGLSESSCEIKRAEYWEHEEKRISYKLASKPVSMHQKNFDVRSTLTMIVTSDKSNSCVLKVVATFDLHFHAASVSKEFVGQFCASEIRLIVWPFFREYITDVTARMHIPPIILPLSDKEEE